MAEPTHYREIMEDSQNKSPSEDFDYLEEQNFSAQKFLDQSSEGRLRILKNQLKSCKEELEERKEIHQEHKQELEEKLQEYRASLTSKSKLRKLAEGDNFRERRSNMVKRVGGIEEEIREGEVEKWRDETELRHEMREIKREIQELEKSYNAMKSFSG